MGLLLSTLITWLPVAAASAAPSCLPDFLSLQVVETVSSVDAPSTHLYPLKSEGGQGRFSTKAVLAVTRAGHALELTALFDPAFDGVSLAYNLYAIELIRDGEVVLWQDFTQECTGPGVSFFPGRKVQLPDLKLSDDKPHRVQILLWGRL